MRELQIQAACKRIEDAGYRFQKKLTDGRMRSIAFVLGMRMTKISMTVADQDLENRP